VRRSVEPVLLQGEDPQVRLCLDRHGPGRPGKEGHLAETLPGAERRHPADLFPLLAGEDARRSFKDDEEAVSGIPRFEQHGALREGKRLQFRDELRQVDPVEALKDRNRALFHGVFTSPASCRWRSSTRFLCYR
jgi:hypothetical protein